ncbi:C2HC5 finger protein [Blastomyces dermatitidis ATCC 18188]|uniref:C2HC5 finger protein n=1 Tax=Ajellomyces dermatitidis (strain ATCC 18188 / CBS 674.68) TaxID=653446 RepID=F2TUY5_AJEDA|nr:C2HC5 finger protein [Blastomyces dermatitidis ATCC 18188]
MPLNPPLKSWALPRLSALLPGLDEDSLTQLLEYTFSLGAEQGAEHLRNILGDSARALEFIVAFGERWRRSGGKAGKIGEMEMGMGEGRGGAQREGRKQPPSASGPLISEYLPNVRSKAARVSGGARRQQQQQQQQQQQGQSSSSPSHNRPSTSTSSTSTISTTATTTTSNIADLTAAIAQLELTTNPSLPTSSSSSPRPRKKCNCQATLHPLFTPAPNCLNCGKIICALEGLQPCSFCQQPLLSAGQVQEMIRELRAERGSEKMRAHNNGKGAARRGELYDETPVGSSSSSSSSHGAGGGGGGATDGPTTTATSSNSSRSSDTTTHRDLAAAKAHRDKLLRFQAQNARRTKVVDEVAEFETPDVHAASTLWMSAGQRALALKRQQKVLREMEERGKEEWERRGGSVVVSLSFEGGGRGKRGLQRGVLRRVEERVEEQAEGEEEEEEEEEVEEEEEEKGEGKGGFGDNPLLAGGGLVRPVWKGKGVDGDQSSSRGERRQRQTWRRVQDDDEDNERWILDGGLYGYGREGREIEGGGE